MKTTITAKEIKSLGRKILSISEKVGICNVVHFKIFSFEDLSGKTKFYVVTREGILNFFGEAQKACCYGKKGIDFKEFKTANEVVKFVNAA